MNETPCQHDSASLREFVGQPEKAFFECSQCGRTWSPASVGVVVPARPAGCRTVAGDDFLSRRRFLLRPYK